MEKLKLEANGKILTALLENNSSAEALKNLLKKGELVIDMHDYGSFEKVGNLGTSLPTNDQQITTTAGDLILYQGNAFVIYYAPNSWRITRLGKIENATKASLLDVLGKANVEVTLSLMNE